MNDIRLPAEWEKQSGILISWPHAQSDWADNLNSIEQTYLNLSQQICRFEKLLVLVYDQPHLVHVRNLLNAVDINSDNLIFQIVKTNDTWTRDYGPISVFKKTIAELNTQKKQSIKTSLKTASTQTKHSKTYLLDFTFNGWGEKFDARLDTEVITTLFKNEALSANECERYNFVLEGGSIECNGCGSLLTTSSCLLNKSRNPLYDKNSIERHLESTLGIRKVLWLNHGYLAGDDTDSHIDMLARFCSANSIVYIKCEDPSDEHYESLFQMERELMDFKTDDGHAFTLFALPLPEAKFHIDGYRLPASYANFLIINQAVLVPTYEDKYDDEALAVLATCFPNHEIIGIPCLAVIQQHGSLHCLTMQLPQGLL